MASEIRVNKIINRSGLSTVTFTDDGAIVSGIVSATVYTGSGANLTNLPAGNLSGTLPAISAANLTNVPAANITGTLPALDGSALTGVGASFGNSSINTSGIITATAFVPTTQGSLSHRNIIINGAQNVAQRGTSGDVGSMITDRFGVYKSGTDETPTQAQVDVASGTTPYTLGFRKSLKITNGNQTSGAGAGDRLFIVYNVEAQDLASSGWNYTDPNSFITLSYWVKSSVAQNFHGYINTQDGTPQAYSFETGSLTANTWTKVTKTIPGNSNIQIDNNNENGMSIVLGIYWGTNYTDAGNTMNQWVAYSSSSRMPDNVTTWYTTNDATFEFTGVQLEVGPVATPFEHRSFGDELIRCKRYFEIIKPGYFNLGRFDNSNGQGFNFIQFQVTKRNPPTASTAGTFRSSSGCSGNISFDSTTVDGASIYTANSTSQNGILYILDDVGDGSLMLKFNAEL